MNSHIENAALLYLLSQDTKSLTADELYARYREALHTMQQCEKNYNETHKQQTFSFQ